MWDERYAAEEYAYGKEPNEFLVSVTDQLPKGKTLCLAEGEGRNAVYLASQGHQVTAVDASVEGMKKAARLAAERSVQIETVVSDLAHFDIQPDSWDVIVSIFAHMPPALRKPLHRKVVRGLRSGGVFVLEAYIPKQLEFKTGGPPHAEFMMSLALLEEELAGLQFTHAMELERVVVEGLYHTGKGAVVQIVGVKP
jgi:SAM-dependent methyltransferase